MSPESAARITTAWRAMALLPALAVVLLAWLLVQSGTRLIEVTAERDEARAKLARLKAEVAARKEGWSCQQYERGSIVAEWCHKRLKGV